MIKRRRRPAKLRSETKPGDRRVDLSDPNRVADFSNTHVTELFFEHKVHNGDAWLVSGARLLRASRVVAERVVLDQERAKAQPAPAGRELPARIGYSAALLATLAVENALKAVIAEGLNINRHLLPPPSKGTPGKKIRPPGELPGDLRDHDLSALAKLAGMRPKNLAERDVLKRGKSITEWLGRYPTTTNRTEQHSSALVRLDGYCLACERLFLRCVAKTAGRHKKKFGGASGDLARDFRRKWVTFYEKAITP